MQSTFDFWRTLKIVWTFLTAMLIGGLLGSDCGQIWMSLAFILIASLLVPAILLATGKLQTSLLQSISYYVFVGFTLFGRTASTSG
jgi:hypothetical protein